MAVRIPVYQDRMTPSGFGVTPQARGVEVSNAIGRGLQSLGQAGSEAALTVARVNRESADLLQKKDDDDALTQAGKTVSDAALHWDQYLKDAAQNAPNGAAGLTPKVIGEFDKYAEQTLAGISNERARKWAAGHFNSLRTSIGSRAISFEAQAGVAERDANVETTYQNLARLAAADPSQYEMGRVMLLSTIANAGYNPMERADRARKYLERYGEQALAGATQKDPEGVKSVVDQTYAKSAPSPVTRNADGTVSLGLDPRLPAGLRNNNPGNIIFIGQKDALGPSVNTDNNGKSRQAVYATPEAGTAAMFELVLKKFDAGSKSVNALIAARGGWTPGNTQAAANIARTMGVAPDAPLNLRDAAQLQRFGRALMTQEHGQASTTYGDALLARVAGDVLAGRAPQAGQAAAAPANPVFAKMAADINVDRLPQFGSAAQTELNRQQATYRAQLTTTEGDHVTAWMNGDPVQKPLTEVDYVKAYGPLDGPQRYANYQQIAVMGADMNALKLATPQQMEETLARYKPQPGAPGYELATKRYDTMVKAVQGIQAQRDADPMLYAIKAGVGGAKPLNWADEAAVVAELNKRAGVAATMVDAYGVKQLSPLTKDEASRLVGGLAQMTPDRKLAYLSTIAKAIPDTATQQAVFGQIAPDSPVTAVAANINTLSDPAKFGGNWWLFSTERQYTPQSVAAMILRGESILNPSRQAKGEDGKPVNMIMPKDLDLRTAFNDQVGKAFANQENAAQVAYQAVKAYYAARLVQDGDYSGQLNSKALKEAIEAVTGGVTEVNGKGEVRRPWGMSETTFNDAAKAAFDAEMQRLGKTGPDAQFRLYGLENTGQGYLVRSGTGYLLHNGQPVTISLDKAPTTGLGTRRVTGMVTRTPVPDRPNTQQPATR